MKKFIFTTVFLCSLPALNLAQIRVTGDGNIGIGTSDLIQNPRSTTWEGNTFHFRGTEYRPNYVEISFYLKSSHSNVYGVDISPRENNLIFPPNSTNPSHSSSLGAINPWYEGFFNNLYFSENLVNFSDAKLKHSIRKLDFDMNRFLRLSPVSFRFVDSLNIAKSDGSTMRFRSTVQEEAKKGFIAQEVAKIYPELVKKDENSGLLMLKPLEFIPLLVKAVQKQQEQIRALNNRIRYLEGRAPGLPRTKAAAKADNAEEPDGSSDLREAALYQNTPNPFSQATEIRYYLPETVGSALLCIYDLQGKQLRQIVLNERGQAALSLSASEFRPGIYLYGLIADGQEIDVKRMILTE